MNKSNLFVRRSHTLDTDKENRPRRLNIPIGDGKVSKRKPKLMPNNKIMQKLFPNFQTLDQERTQLEKPEPITFRKLDPGDDEQKVFRDLFQEQRAKYEAIFTRYMITERPSRHEIKEFLTKGKQTTLKTYRF